MATVCITKRTHNNFQLDSFTSKQVRKCLKSYANFTACQKRSYKNQITEINLIWICRTPVPFFGSDRSALQCMSYCLIGSKWNSLIWRMNLLKHILCLVVLVRFSTFVTFKSKYGSEIVPMNGRYDRVALPWLLHKLFQEIFVPILQKRIRFVFSLQMKSDWE